MAHPQRRSKPEEAVLSQYHTFVLLLQLNVRIEQPWMAATTGWLPLKASREAWLRKAFGFQAPRLLI
jgi:hypothetical protein